MPTDIRQEKGFTTGSSLWHTRTGGEVEEAAVDAEVGGLDGRLTFQARCRAAVRVPSITKATVTKATVTKATVQQRASGVQAFKLGVGCSAALWG